LNCHLFLRLAATNQRIEQHECRRRHMIASTPSGGLKCGEFV
jgi:hypothetical protein